MQQIKYINKTAVSLVALILLFTSCKKDGLQLYNQELSGSSVYFPEAVGTTKSTAIVKTVSFGYVGYSKKDSVLAIPVAVTGDSAATDRPLKLAVAASSTAVEGTHFSLLKSPVIRAGKVADTVFLKLNRTVDMTAKQFEIDLVLQENQFFGIKMHDTTSNYLTYKVIVDDIAGKSYLWVNNVRGVVSYFGDYSRRKVDLIIEVLQLDANLFYEPQNTSFFTAARLISFSRYMVYWLNKEAEQGRIYYDENGVRITMGSFAG